MLKKIFEAISLLQIHLKFSQLPFTDMQWIMLAKQTSKGTTESQEKKKQSRYEKKIYY